MNRAVVALKFSADEATSQRFAEVIASSLAHDLQVLAVDNFSHDNCVSLTDLPDYLEQIDASFLVVEFDRKTKIQALLNAFRPLRIPYLFVPRGSQPKFDCVALPVTYLDEEKEKAPFASAFGRFFGTKIAIFQPKDYGSRAARNIESMKTLFDKFSLDYETIQARRDSQKVELEATLWAGENADLAIVSASREYGLDDLIFGSKERKILEKTSIPVLLINPRGDLYALCD